MEQIRKTAVVYSDEKQYDYSTEAGFRLYRQWRKSYRLNRALVKDMIELLRRPADDEQMLYEVCACLVNKYGMERTSVCGRTAANNVERHIVKEKRGLVG